jgi:hypothetical protein
MMGTMSTRFHALLQRLKGEPSRARAFARAATIFAVVPTLLAGCATYTAYSPQGLAAGSNEAEVLARMGPATARHGLPSGGTRLEFARGPMGRHTYMLDMGADGRLLRWTQVLDEAHFAQVTDGMPVQALLQHLGRPAERMGVRQGEVWSSRVRHQSATSGVFLAPESIKSTS